MAQQDFHDQDPNAEFDPKKLLRPAFPGLEEADLERLAEAADVGHYSAGTVLCREGEYGDTFYLIVDGQACVSKYLDEANPRRVLHWLGPGDFFGEVAIIQGDTRTATVDTEAAITVLEIHRDALMQVLEHSAPMAIRMILQVTSRLRDADRQAIADLRQINAELRQAYHNLERLDRAKADFISVVGHELRTPLTVISGYANMLKSAAKIREDESLSTLLGGMTGSVQRLHAIINSILDVSKIDVAALKARRVPLSIAVLIKQVRVTFQDALDARSLTFESEGLSELPFILGDSDLLYKAFYHLIMNAIKYTPDGGQIRVSGKVAEAREGQRVIELAFRDTGIGIDPEHQDLVFDKFYQTGEVMLHSSGTTKFKGGGPGLGLAIVKGAIEAHDGAIWVESAGHDEDALPGSCFYVRLPVEMWEQGKTAQEAGS
jgi:signal transduction histidine kinase